jgi:hypothetical protein
MSVLTMEVMMVASRLLWFQTPLVVLLLARPRNWYDLSPDYLAKVFMKGRQARLQLQIILNSLLLARMLCPSVVPNMHLCSPQLIVGLFAILVQRLLQNTSIVAALFIMVFF